MKKTNFLLSMLSMVMAAMLSVQLTSCGDDDKKDPGTINPKESIGAFVTKISYNGGTLMSMTYDNQSRLIRMDFSKSYVTISYGSTLTITDNEEGITYTAELNSKGYISSMSGQDGDGYSASISCDYDNEGHLLKMSVRGNDAGDVYTSTIEHTWNNGLLTRVSINSSEDGNTYNATMVYGDYENKQKQFFYGQPMYDNFVCALYAAGLVGVMNNKLPVEMQGTGEGGSQEKASFSYTFNDNGTIKTQTQTQNGRSVDLSYSY